MTIKDIARLAGVSVATVSRTINNDSTVHPQTRTRIQDIIARTGYVPNYVGKQLRVSKSNKILVLLPTITNSFYSDILCGIEDAAYQNGYSVIIFSTRFDAAIERRGIDMLLTRQVDGVISFFSQMTPETFSKSIANVCPFVQCCEIIAEYQCPKVTIDNAKAAQDAISYFVHNGRRHIAMIGGSLYPFAAEGRERGYHSALAGTELSEDSSLMVRSDFSAAGGYNACRELFSHSVKPDAVFAFSDIMAVGAIRYLNEQGIHVGSDVEVIGFDDDSISGFYTPTISTVMQPRYEFGTTATNLLFEKIANVTTVDKYIVFPHRLIHRESTNPRV